MSNVMKSRFWPPSLERLPISLLITLGSVVWVHALFGVLRALFSLPFLEFAPASASLTWAALATGVAASVEPERWRRATLFGALGGGLAAGAFATLTPKAFLPSLALPLVGGAFGWLHVLLCARAPRGILAELKRSTRFRFLWVALSLVALLQVARLSTYVSNPDSNWFLSTGHAFYAKHECQNAYFYGAELGQRGETDLYDPAHYPGLNPHAEPRSDLEGMHPEDPYQYPPTFLLLPRLFMAFSSDYAALRGMWFAVNFTLCMSAVVALGLWVGRRQGWKVLLLSPALLVAFPVLYNFQYGQFHFAAIALSVLGMLTFRRRRYAAGGTLLALGIVAKLFPALLLFVLAGRRQWSAVRATLGAIVAFGALGLLVIGPQAHEAFAVHHVPRLLDGSAFAFGEAWPEVADLVVAGNQGIAGIFQKLVLMGVDVPATVTQHIGVVYLLSLPVLAYAVGALGESDSPADRAVKWLGVLGLGSLASAGAWADYVPLTAAWVLLYLIASESSRRGRGILLVAAFLQFTLLGTIPLGPYSDASWMTPLSLIGALLLLGVFLRAAIGRVAPSAQGAPSSAGALAGPVHSMRHE